MGTQLLLGVLGLYADSSSLITCHLPRRNTSGGGVFARVRSKQAAGTAGGLGEVVATCTRPRHTWETGKGRDQRKREHGGDKEAAVGKEGWRESCSRSWDGRQTGDRKSVV